MKITAFCGMSLYSLKEECQCFGGTKLLQHIGNLLEYISEDSNIFILVCFHKFYV
jgi:hypothetical protein